MNKHQLLASIPAGCLPTTSDNIDYDLVRTQYLNSIDIKVIRYSNIDIDKNLEGVVIDIKQIVEQRIKEIR